MNGRKPKGHVGGLGGSNAQSAPFKWINVPLTSEDFRVLENEKASLEQLALAYIDLGVRGFGLSIKFDRVRKSYNVSIYGSDLSNDNYPCGISGSSDVLRDALLVSLYRFNTGLQGSFDGQSNSDSTVQSARFR